MFIGMMEADSSLSCVGSDGYDICFQQYMDVLKPTAVFMFLDKACALWTHF